LPKFAIKSDMQLSTTESKDNIPVTVYKNGRNVALETSLKNWNLQKTFADFDNFFSKDMVAGEQLPSLPFGFLRLCNLAVVYRATYWDNLFI